MKTAFNYLVILALYLCCPFEIKAQMPSATQSTYTGKPIFQILTKRNNTTLGIIRVELFPLIAPKHVRNFDSLVSVQFFDTIAFHRVVPGFVIQGGDPNSRHGNPCSWGYGQAGQPTVNAEFSNAKHLRGIVSAARSNNINSATSQFFICVADAPNLNNSYSVYGRVSAGMNWADTIVNAPRLTTNVNGCAPGVVYTSMPVQKIEMFISYVGSNDSIPNAPSLNSPASGTFGVDTTTYLTLKWNKVNEAILYHLDVATDSNFVNVVKSATLSTLSYNVTGLLGNTDYYWRVKTNNGGRLSASSPVWMFTTSFEDPTASIATNSGLNASPRVYPNPGEGNFMFSDLVKGSLLEIFDLSGKLVYNHVMKENMLSVCIMDYDKGIYFYRITYPSKEMQLHGKLLLK